MATSFYNERNEDIADALVKLLLETKQEIPDFLDSYKPDNVEELQFNDDDDHVYMIFSATFPKKARAVAKEYMSNQHIRICVGRAGSLHKNVTQKVSLKLQTSPDRLLTSIRSFRSIKQSSAIACSTFSYPCHRLAPSFSSTRRRGQTSWKISSTMHIINYDMPSFDHGGIHEYVHRIGRTARMTFWTR